MTDVIIIGAGITGLACAWRLQKLGIECLILESTERPGGVIRSERVGDYLIEWGPNSLLPTADNFPLLDEAGLTAHIVEGDRRAPRFICHKGALRKAPFGPMSLAGLIRAAAEPLIRQPAKADESVHEFFVRRVGAEAEERLVSPFVTGIYAGNTRELSMAATFPKLARMEKDHGSLVGGMFRSKRPEGGRRGRTCSFDHGMETLPQRLAGAAQVTYRAQSLRVSDNLEINGSFGTTRARAVIVTAPAYQAAEVLRTGFPNLARLLEVVDYAPMVIAISAAADSAFPEPLRGFGFLVPRAEKLHLLGTLFSSALFPGRAPQGRQLLTSFVGGALEREAINWPEERLWDAVVSELKKVLRLSTAPDPVRLVRRTHAIPQYKIGHEHFVARLRGELAKAPGLFLAGNYIEGISVAACMETGERVARETAAFIGGRS